MKKKIVSIISLVVVLILCTAILIACSPYEENPVGGGEANAATQSNGGYFVKQGNYAYFINGYVGDNDANDWGQPLKQSIMRAEFNADGTINNDTAVVIVPKSIFNTNVNGGFAIFGEWIYYATPNNTQNKEGVASTTHTDFMRTKIDASITQLIGTINSRESEYLFTPTRVLYKMGETIYYLDFSGMETDKSSDNEKGVARGNLIENVSSVYWGYDSSYQRSQGSEISDYIFYTQSMTGDDAYLFYNKTFAIRYDGTDKKEIINNTTYLTEDEKDIIEENPENQSLYLDRTYKIALMDAFVEDSNNITLYYSKSISVGEEETKLGLFMAKYNMEDGLDLGSEKQLTSQEITGLYPLGYNKGILGQKSSIYYWFDGVTSFDNALQITDSSDQILNVSGDIVYYCTTGSVDTLYKIYVDFDKKLDSDRKGETYKNEAVVMKQSFKSDWLLVEFFDDKMFFFETKYSYVNYIDLVTFDSEDEDAESTFIGKMTQADADKKAEDDKAEEEAKEDAE